MLSYVLPSVYSQLVSSTTIALQQPAPLVAITPPQLTAFRSHKQRRRSCDIMGKQQAGSCHGGLSSPSKCRGEKQAGGPPQEEEWEGGAAAGDGMQAAAFQARKKRSCSRGPQPAAAAGGAAEGGCVAALGGGGAFACPRDRLQRHRLQVAGTVRIPDGWCGEARLREWVSSRDVEEALQPPGLISARAALISACCSSPAGLVSPITPC